MKTVGCATEVFKGPIRTIEQRMLCIKWLKRTIWKGWDELGICQGDPHKRSCPAPHALSLGSVSRAPILAERSFPNQGTLKSILKKEGSGLTGLKASQQMAVRQCQSSQCHFVVETALVLL